MQVAFGTVHTPLPPKVIVSTSVGYTRHTRRGEMHTLSLMVMRTDRRTVFQGRSPITCQKHHRRRSPGRVPHPNYRIIELKFDTLARVEPFSPPWPDQCSSGPPFRLRWAIWCPAPPYASPPDLRAACSTTRNAAARSAGAAGCTHRPRRDQHQAPQQQRCQR